MKKEDGGNYTCQARFSQRIQKLNVIFPWMDCVWSGDFTEHYEQKETFIEGVDDLISTVVENQHLIYWSKCSF